MSKKGLFQTNTSNENVHYLWDGYTLRFIVSSSGRHYPELDTTHYAKRRTNKLVAPLEYML